MALDPSEFGPGSEFQRLNPDYNQLTPQQQVMRGYAWGSDPNAPAPEGAQWGGWQRVGSGAPGNDNDIVNQFIGMLMGGGAGNFSGGRSNQPNAPQFSNAEINQLMQMLMGGGTGGAPGGGSGGMPGGGFRGGNPMMPGMNDPLGMGGGGMGDPLGMLGMMGGGGLNPYQAADLRLQRNNKMNALRQRMANQHRAIGRAGGTDYSRHVQNIDDEMMALQNQAMQQNINNAFRASQEALAWARFNQSQDQDYWERLLRFWAAVGTFGGAKQADQQQPQQGGQT